MTRVSARIGAISESATMAISNRAKEMRTEGRDVISFGAGEPDYETPAHIVEAAVAAARDAANHKYSANAGLAELRAAIAQRTSSDNALSVSPSQVLVTNGGKQAVFQSLAALVDPGDEIIVPAPYWVTYPEAVKLAGGVPVVVPTTVAAGFKVTVDQLESAWTPRTKALMFVSPSNPTGAVYDPEETAAIGRWAAERGVWVLSDDIYQYLVYGDSTFTSLPGVTPELGDRWVIIHGVSKTYAMTGWRVGWMIGPPDVIGAAADHQSHATSNVSNVSQRAALAALTGPSEPAEAMRLGFDRRRIRMHAMLEAMPGVSCAEPRGAFYCFPSFEETLTSGRFASSEELCAEALERAEIALVPGEAFGAPGHARLSYALSDDDLVEGLTRLHRFLD
ncbi:MAG TPA: pyridoxal phosphate-dependent aminotransferase [Acidimicrobiia bacterium]|nr:pyridoxal phosphate-dependent aminotransferase [Acidimicrobiia bacterium]